MLEHALLALVLLISAPALANANQAKSPIVERHGGVPLAAVSEAIATLPDTRALVYAQTRHAPFAEQRDRFDADLMAFAKSRP
jgi:hypothetical protein